MAKRLLFIDRDGTLIKEPVDEQIDSFDKLEFVEGMFKALSFIAEHTDYDFIMVSNQDGLGTDSFPEDTFWPVHNFIIKTLKDMSNGMIMMKKEIVFILKILADMNFGMNMMKMGIVSTIKILMDMKNEKDMMKMVTCIISKISIKRIKKGINTLLYFFCKSSIFQLYII